MEGAPNRSQSQASPSSTSSSTTAGAAGGAHSESPRLGQQEGDFTLPHYGVQQIPQTYKELAEPWIKVSEESLKRTNQVAIFYRRLLLATWCHMETI